MAVVGVMAFMIVPSFMAGIITMMVWNYVALRKWRRETQPRKQRWYHTWHRH
jgi:hypothetical protein